MKSSLKVTTNIRGYHKNISRNFWKTHNANVLVIGDQKVIIDISENLKSYHFGKYF